MVRKLQRTTVEKRWRHGLIVGWLMACGNGDVTEPAAAEAASARPIVPTAVNLPVLLTDPGFAHDAEFRGLVTAALELGFSDMPGVVPVLPGASATPSFLLSRPVVRRTVDATLVARGKPEALVLELELCVPGGSCNSISAGATNKNPWEAVGALLDGAAEVLGVDIAEATRKAWRTPGSRDSYSEFITGRAAAQLYGLIPPSDKPGDKKADPVLKALFLDPGQPLAHWIRARWEMATTPDGGKAAESLAKAQLLRPTSPIFAADAATLDGLIGAPAESLLAWETLVSVTGDDPRWLEPLARAYVAADRPAEALPVLARMPEETSWDPEVAELRVLANERAGGTDLDPLLARWQTVASGLATPVEKRIGLRVQHGEYEAAEALVPALRSRSPGPTTDALEVALLLAQGRYEQAEAQAPADVGARIHLRRMAELGRPLGDDAGSATQLAGITPVEIGLIAADEALRTGDGPTALAATDDLLSREPGLAAAWSLRARALALMGRSEEAAEAYGAAWESDPACDGGPVGEHRIASTFRYVEAGVLPDGPVGEGAVGPQGPEL